MLYYGTYNGKKISKGLDIKGGNLIQYLCYEERDINDGFRTKVGRFVRVSSETQVKFQATTK